METMYLLPLFVCCFPVVVFVVAIYKTQPPRTLRERGLRVGSSIRCPRCNTLVPGEAILCTVCEARFDEIVMPIRAYRPEFEGHETIAVCIRCGRLNGPKWTECKHCHTPLERPVRPSKELSTKKWRFNDKS